MTISTTKESLRHATGWLFTQFMQNQMKHIIKSIGIKTYHFEIKGIHADCFYKQSWQDNHRSGAELVGGLHFTNLSKISQCLHKFKHVTVSDLRAIWSHIVLCMCWQNGGLTQSFTCFNSILPFNCGDEQIKTTTKN